MDDAPRSDARSAGTPPRRWRLVAFWLCLTGFVGWDLAASSAVDLRQEPPVFAAGSGRAGTGGHCAMPR